MKWTEKSIHTFFVQGVSLDGRGNPYYTLKNAEDVHDEDIYRVRVMDYQIEWKALPKKIRCCVRRTYEDGYPLLFQLRRDLLEDVYATLPAIHTMTIMGKKVDEHSHQPYFQLQDSAKLLHRYYYTPEDLDLKYQIGEEIELYVEQIKGSDTNAYLDLKELQLRRAESELYQIKRTIPAIEGNADEKYYLPEDQYEDEQHEWKSSIVFPAGHSAPDMDKQLSIIARTVCGFLNRNGGELLIGITDRGRIIGIENEFESLYSQSLERKYSANRDGYESALRDALREKLGNYIIGMYVSINFKTWASNLTTCTITVQPSPIPAYFDEVALYMRLGNMTARLKGDDITRFIMDRTQKVTSTQIQTVLQEADPEECDNLEEAYSMIGDGSEEQENLISQRANLLPGLPQSKSSRERYAQIARVIVFRKDGEARFEDDYVAPNENILWQQEIPRRVLTNSHRYSLILCYESGRINRVPLSLLNINGRGTVNGWNTKGKLFNIFLAHDDDKVAIYTQIEATWYVKVHQLSAITPHTWNQRLHGNLCSIRDNEGCRIYHITSQHRDIENLMLLDAYRYRVGISLESADSYDHITMRTLLEACEEHINN